MNHNHSTCTGHCGLSEADRLAETAVERTLEELLASVDPYDIPAYAGSEILPGLYQGGTEDDDVVQRGRDERWAHESPYDVVVTLYASASPAPWGVEELRFGFLDSALEGADVARVVRAAQFAFRRWLDGDRVLIRCQAGLNRSGLVMALVLIQAGLSPAQAVSVIRENRAGAALFNRHFVRWLLEHGEEAVGGARVFEVSPERAA